ncbi:MAG: type II secretion system F family protein [Candidatus Kerfeldbacteria bacterium]|nr:type II secretion system F family protein [Candidatus Kerfeldbacteria bacterium]
MATYSYEAVNQAGQAIKGVLAAANRQEAIGYLLSHHLTPMVIEEVGGSRPAFWVRPFERFTAIDRIVMMRNLGATVQAGVNLTESLDILVADATKQTARAILLDAKTNVQNGLPLSTTFQRYHRYFPPIYVGMLRAAEASGQLAQTLDELAQYSEKIHLINHRIKSALSYPVLLLAGTLGVVVLLLTFVLPRITKAFYQANVELPAMTKVLLVISTAVTKYPLLDVLGLAVIVWLVIQFRRPGRRFLIRLISILPVARELMKKLALVRFSRSLGSMLRSGVSITEAVQLAGQAVGNETYQRVLDQAAERVANGVPLSQTLKEHPKLFPRFFSSLVAAGEKSGTTEEVLRSFSEFYDAEIDTTIKDLTTFLEPALLLFMGAVVGIVALSILLPIYQFIGSFT